MRFSEWDQRKIQFRIISGTSDPIKSMKLQETFLEAGGFLGSSRWLPRKQGRELLERLCKFNCVGDETFWQSVFHNNHFFRIVKSAISS